MTKAPYIIWKDDYSVHRNELDLHHRRIVEIINELHEAIGCLAADEDVAALLREVREYAQKHFIAEEGLMEKAHYPGLDEQRQAHLGYIKTVARLSHEDAQAPSVLSESLLRFLKEWWLNHILSVDMKYVPFLKDS